MPTVGNSNSLGTNNSPGNVTLQHGPCLIIISVYFGAIGVPPTAVTVDGNPASLVMPGLVNPVGVPTWLGVYYFYAPYTALSTISVSWAGVSQLNLLVAEIDNTLSSQFFDAMNEIETVVNPYQNPIAAGTPNRIIIEAFAGGGLGFSWGPTSGQQAIVDQYYAATCVLAYLYPGNGVTISGTFTNACGDIAFGIIDLSQDLVWRKRGGFFQ